MNPRRDVIENSVKEAIEITLTAIKKMYDEDLV
jgi:uridine phosphorylase